MNYKTCSNCGKTLPATLEYFHKNKSGKYGLMARCKECRSLIRRERYANNPEPIKEYKRQWRKSNPEKYQAQLRRNKDRYSERYAESQRDAVSRYYQNNKNDRKEYIAEWKKDNIEKCRTYQQRRRMKINEVGGDFSSDELEERIEEQGCMCFYCSHPLEDDYHVDHYVPISKGGSNSIENIVIACPSCNFAKNARDPHEFMASIGRTFV